MKPRVFTKLIKNEKNFGKGYSVKKGLEVSAGDYVLIQDADEEYDPNDYYKILEPLKSRVADVVYGSRFIGSDKKRVLYFWKLRKSISITSGYSRTKI